MFWLFRGWFFFFQRGSAFKGGKFEWKVLVNAVELQIFSQVGHTVFKKEKKKHRRTALNTAYHNSEMILCYQNNKPPQKSFPYSCPNFEPNQTLTIPQRIIQNSML